MAKKTTDEPQDYSGPSGNDDGPPSHEETLGAIAGVPEEVAQEYAETGVTPDNDWRKSQTAGVHPDTIAGHKSRRRKSE